MIFNIYLFLAGMPSHRVISISDTDNSIEVIDTPPVTNRRIHPRSNGLRHAPAVPDVASPGIDPVKHVQQVCEDEDFAKKLQVGD